MLDSPYFKGTKGPGYYIFEMLTRKLNLFDTPRVLNQFESILKEIDYPNIIVDLQKVDHIDSVGIGFLIAIKNVTSKQGSVMVVVSNNETTLKVLTLTKMDRFFKVLNSLDAACDYFQKEKK